MVFFLNSCKRHTLKSGLGPGPLEKTDPGPFEKADLIPNSLYEFTNMRVVTSNVTIVF